MSHFKFFAGFCILATLLTACGTAPTPPPPTSTLEPTQTPTPVPERLTLYYQGNAQVELVSPAGTRVMLDVANPKALTNLPESGDVLLSTHTHSDHYVKSFAESFPGKSMLLQAGQLDVADVHIESVLSSGAYYQQQIPGENTLYVIEMSGLRIAHLGDLAQTEFTPAQLEILKDIDILIFAFESQYGDMTLENKNGFNLVAAIQPRLVIPTHHTTKKGIEFATQTWGGYALNGPLSVSRADLPMETKLLVMGPMAESYKTLFKLSEWPGGTQ